MPATVLQASGPQPVPDQHELMRVADLELLPSALGEATGLPGVKMRETVCSVVPVISATSCLETGKSVLTPPLSRMPA